MKPIEQQDLLSYRFLSSLRYAPGGERAAFCVSNAAEDRESYESRLWLYENGALRQLTELGKERGFVWLDPERLLFPAARSEKEKKRAETGDDSVTWYVLNVHGGEARPFFTLPFAAERLFVLDETHFAVLGGIDKTDPERYAAEEKDRAEAFRRQKEERDYEVLDELPFCFNGAGYTNGRRTALFLVTTAPFSVHRVTAAGEDVSDAAVVGGKLYYAVSKREAKLALKGFRLCRMDVGGETEELFRREELFAGLEAGETLLWLFASSCERYGLNENPWVYRFDPAKGEPELVRAEEYALYNSVGTDCRLGGGRSACGQDGALWHLKTVEGDCLLCRLDADGEDRVLLDKPGSVECFDLSGGEALLVGLFDMGLQELYRLELESGALTRLSHFNDEALAERYVARPEPIAFKSEGLSLGGWLLRPKDFAPDKRYPAILDIHGGPKTVYGPVFYHEMQLWASRGFFVLFCNIKGSDGRDNAFADVRGAYGETDYRNLMDFVDEALRLTPEIDPQRLCVTGGSYGGFMTNWIIGHTDRFCCAASQRSISNFLSFYGTSDIGFAFAADQAGGDIYQSPEKLWERSPLRYAAHVKTPTLFIHADEDYRCPLEQGLQMYAALVDRGVEARLCLFHGENHELSRSGKPKHRLRRLQELTDWFDRHTTKDIQGETT